MQVATFAQLRLSELAGLTRDRLDLTACEVHITNAKPRGHQPEAIGHATGARPQAGILETFEKCR